jgi:16S rRNA (cytidine1402-2'-O)-methyltransferase
VTPRGGRLVLCGTPIGNLQDATFRLVTTLEQARVIACEDAGRTRKLLSHFGIKTPELVVYNDGNERRMASQLVERIAGGITVVLVSDAGMPGLSDPGYRLVKACIDRALPVEIVPGPTSVVTALVVSGLPTDRFVFEGWLPRKGAERARRVAELAGDTRTLVFFCSPHRIEADVAALLEGFGERPAALVRELTKLHEEVRRGSLAELVTGLAEQGAKGEIVLVVGGASQAAKPQLGPAELALEARRLMDEGLDRKEALARVAREAQVPRRRVFDALVEDGDKN